MRIFLAGLSTRKWVILAEQSRAEQSRAEQSRAEDDKMKIFLAGGNQKEQIIPLVHGNDENISNGWNEMKIYLACVAPWKEEGLYDKSIRKHKPFILESFYYAGEWTEKMLPLFGDFMLDSGAFTFCGTGGFHEHEFEEYLERYADFINRNSIEKFFELDVDSIVGYEKVLKYRKKLEKLTNRQCIPVWHIARGKEEFLRHCDEYSYVALGGYVAAIKNGDPRQRAYVKMYPWFISEAHKRDTKIHGLGFTNLKGLEMYHFDSVDSTAWTTGNRFGYIYRFDGRTMQKIVRPEGKILADSKKVALNNYIEWIKFQKYAEENL